VTAKFSKAVGAPYLLGKTVTYQGVVERMKRKGRPGDDVVVLVKEHVFKVDDSEEEISCPHDTAMSDLIKLFQ